MGIREVIQQTNNLSPRWVGLNLLAPTYNNSLKILQGLDSSINVMLGGHQTRAMSQEILKDSKIPRIRDEFSSSLNYSFSKMPIEHVRQTISEIMINQKNRLGK